MGKLYVLICLVLLPYISVGDDRSNELMEMWNTFLHHPSRTIDHMFHHNEANDKYKKECPGCLHGPNVNELRLNFVQNQILRKLRLAGKPSVRTSNIPSPVAAGATMMRSHAQEEPREDEFFGKLDQKIVFTNEGK